MIKTRTNSYFISARKSIILLLFLISASLSYTSAQEFKTNILSFHVGYSDLFNGTDGLTSSDHQYNKTLSKGFSWDLQYTRRLGEKMGLGGIYAQYRSHGKHAEGKDRISTHYFAPQLNLFLLDKKKIYAKLASGIGGVLYDNNSEVFGKSRQTVGFSLGVNVGVTAGIKFHENWSIETELDYFGCSLNKIVSSYHDEIYTIEFPQNKSLELSRLSFSLGLSYAF